MKTKKKTGRADFFSRWSEGLRVAKVDSEDSSKRRDKKLLVDAMTYVLSFFCSQGVAARRRSRKLNISGCAHAVFRDLAPTTQFKAVRERRRKMPKTVPVS
eukprot:GEMP01087856.1.p1 GENE.GEMP01087856.1~~GEMP01087856.1.p1  ORF type:complete len:101 (+),score=11.27 GEMP01087856.1:138-440(+)